MSEKKRHPGRYPDEFRERAMRMVLEDQHEYPSQWKAIESIAKKLQVNHETLRQWACRVEADTGDRPGVTTDERARMKALERENKELRRANEILNAASVFFGAELDRQSKK
jgi:transposase